MKKVLFSITRKDFKIDYFSGTGGGGQHRNKHQNCVRLHHIDSGALVTGQSSKERKANRKEAFKNLVAHPKFKIWHTKVVHEALTGESIDDKVDKMMQIDNLLIEGKSNKKWVPINNTCGITVDGFCLSGNPNEDCAICNQPKHLRGR